MLTLDVSDFARAASRVQRLADQMPFAISRTLNEAAKTTRSHLIEETWPSAVKVKNANFLRVALSTEWASKAKLSVAITDKKLQGRGNLALHAKGGTRRPVRGAAMAVPSQDLKSRRGARGVPKNLQPSSLPNSFRKGDVLYQRTGKYVKGTKRKKGYDNRGLVLRYVFKRATAIRKDVPFVDDFNRTMKTEILRQFPIQMTRAIATSKR